MSQPFFDPEDVIEVIMEGPQGPPGGPGAPGPPGSGAEEAQAALDAHLADETPHPVYDDQPLHSFELIFENALL